MFGCVVDLFGGRDEGVLFRLDGGEDSGSGHRSIIYFWGLGNVIYDM